MITSESIKDLISNMGYVVEETFEPYNNELKELKIVISKKDKILFTSKSYYDINLEIRDIRQGVWIQYNHVLKNLVRAGLQFLQNKPSETILN